MDRERTPNEERLSKAATAICREMLRDGTDGKDHYITFDNGACFCVNIFRIPDNAIVSIAEAAKTITDQKPEPPHEPAQP